MAYEQKPGQFVLFKNDKGDNDKRPDYRGDGLDLNGNPIEVAAWIKEGKKGKFMSCTIKTKAHDHKYQPPAGADKKPAGKFDDMADDVPFISCELNDDAILKKLRKDRE